MKIDLHIHSIYSFDSLSKIEDILKKSEESGLKVIAITDHNTIDGAKKAKLIAKKNKYNIMVIIGEEHKTNKGDIIGLFLKKKLKKYDYSEVINEIRKQNGIVLLPHPKEDLDCDIIENYNAKKNKSIKFKTRKGCFSNSDAHLLSDIGKSYTILPDFKNEAELKRKIKNCKLTMVKKRNSKLSLILSFFVPFFKRFMFVYF